MADKSVPLVKDEVDGDRPIPEVPEVVDAEDGEEELDPRVQFELEKLNRCTDEINRLELRLEDTNGVFRTLLSDSTQQLKATASKVGAASIEKARPFYEAQKEARLAQKECQSAATHYQRASGVHEAAKETVALAEQRFLSNSTDWEFDNAWQEMLNHATIKVMQAEKDKTESEAEHAKRASSFTKAEQKVQVLEKKLNRHIVKSKQYFEEKEAFNRALESQKSEVQRLQEMIKACKSNYARSLRALEEISESIHARRQLKRTAKHQRLALKLAAAPADEGSVENPLDFNLDRLQFSSVSSFSTVDDDNLFSISGRSESSNATTTEDSGISCDDLTKLNTGQAAAGFKSLGSKPRHPELNKSRRTLSCPMEILHFEPVANSTTSLKPPLESAELHDSDDAGSKEGNVSENPASGSAKEVEA